MENENDQALKKLGLESLSGGRYSKCKGPEATDDLVCSSKAEEASEIKA